MNNKSKLIAVRSSSIFSKPDVVIGWWRAVLRGQTSFFVKLITIKERWQRFVITVLVVVFSSDRFVEKSPLFFFPPPSSRLVQVLSSCPSITRQECWVSSSVGQGKFAFEDGRSPTQECRPLVAMFYFLSFRSLPAVEDKASQSNEQEQASKNCRRNYNVKEQGRRPLTTPNANCCRWS